MKLFTVLVLTVLAFSVQAQELKFEGKYQLESTSRSKLCDQELTVTRLADGSLRFNGIKDFEYRNPWGWWMPDTAPDMIVKEGEVTGPKTSLGKVYKGKTKIKENKIVKRAKLQRYYLWPFSLKVIMSIRQSIKLKQKWYNHGSQRYRLHFRTWLRPTGASIIGRFERCVYQNVL